MVPYGLLHALGDQLEFGSPGEPAAHRGGHGALGDAQRDSAEGGRKRERERRALRGAEVLAEYAQRWRADSHTWLFLTGSEEAIRKVAGHFGVVYWSEEGAITHTSSTAIIDRAGKLRALVEGSSFTSQQLIDLVESVTEPRP